MTTAVLLLASLFVRIDTTAGAMTLQLDPVHAPISTAAFMRCVDSGKYNGTTFYRIVRPGNQSPHRPIQVIQGGLNADRDPFGTIPLEPTSLTGLRNLAGTIGVPRDKDPNTGVGCDFFINMIDNPLLDSDHSADHHGYAVFGHIVRGMDVARKILAAPAKGQTLTPPIRIGRITRVPRAGSR